MVNRVKLYWEAAYATHFDIQLSTDGVEYTTVYTATNAQGGTQDISLPTGPVDARYVRIFCQQRNTGYGASLWEVEVYGVKAPTSVEQPSVETITTKYILRNGQIYILRNHEIYDLRGQKVEEN